MRRERYKGHILVARLHKVRNEPIWRVSALLDLLANGQWQEVPIERGLEGQEFANKNSALATALEFGRSYVDAIRSVMPFQRTSSASPKNGKSTVFRSGEA
jgi:hypothetical protein